MRLVRSRLGVKTALAMAACAAIAVSTALYGGSDAGVAHAQQTRAEVMAVKLSLAQELLEKITLEQYDDIERLSNSMLKVSEDSQWAQTQTEQYELFASDFKRRAAQMEQAARDRNLAQVTLSYTSMIQTCVECHDSARAQSKLAKLLQ